MTKQGFYLGNIPQVIPSPPSTSGWALCIGAGTSVPLFPSWNELVLRLIAITEGADNAGLIADSVLSNFSPDAAIQAARLRLGLSPEEFVELLADEVYRDAKESLNKQELRSFTRMISSHSGQHGDSEWRDYLRLVEEQFPVTSAFSIAKIIAETMQIGLAPAAILSFNAEPFLASLINGHWRVESSGLKDKSSNDVQGNKKMLDLIFESVSTRRPHRIPYFFCHGLLPVPSETKSHRLVGAPDKLIFSESDYLQLAGTAYSWQANVFTDVASSRSIIFIGVSMTDPNMRRWLSLVHSNRVGELETRRSFTGESAPHYWIRTRPESHLERRWIEAIVAEMGIRIVWIQEWDEIDDALRPMLGI